MNVKDSILPIFMSFGLLVISLSLVITSKTNLPQHILHKGRIVLSSEIHAGKASALYDTDLNTSLVLTFPDAPPEGTYLLADLALSHFPPEQHPEPRKPQKIIVYNGRCTNCARPKFLEYSRIKKATIEILARRANDPDVENFIPPSRILYTRDVELADMAGPQSIGLEIPRAPKSISYPENVSYLIVKIIAKEVYSGTLYPNTVAIAEIQYVDSGDDGRYHTWGIE